MDKHQVKGRVKEAKGMIKEDAGEFTGNEDLRDKGKIEKGIGKIQSKWGDLKNDIKEDMEDDENR